MDYEKPRLFEIDADKGQGHCEPGTSNIEQCKIGTHPGTGCKAGNEPGVGSCKVGTGA